MATTSPFAKYNQATLLAAAQKLIAGSGKQAANPYKNLTAQQIIDNAAWNPTYTTALQGAIAQLPAAAPVAPVVAKQNTTVTTTTPNTGPQPISAAAVAQANQQLKAANAAGFTTVADYNKALNLAQNAGFGSDLNAYNAYVAKTNAAINPAIKPAVAATTGANAIKPPTPAGAYVPPSTVAPVAPVAPTAAAPVVPKGPDVAAINAAQNAFTTALNSGKITADDIATYKSAMKTLGGSVSQSNIDRATSLISQKFQDQLATVKTQSELDALVAQAKAAGAPINQGWIDATTKGIQQQQAAADAQAKAEATQKLNNQLYDINKGVIPVKSQADIDAVVKQAKDQGLTIDPNILYKAQQRVDTIAKDAAWSPPDTAGISTFGAQRSYATAPSGLQLIGLPTDPITGTKAGWYVDTGSGYQAWDKGPSGSVIPYKDFGQQNSTVFGDIQDYQQQQKTQQAQAEATALAKNTTDFEKALPDAQQYINNGYKTPGGNTIYYGPDHQTQYMIQPANQATGEPAQWVKMNANTMAITNVGTGKTLSNQDYNKQVTAIQTANNQVQLQQREAQAQADAHKNDFTWDDFGKVLGIVGIAALGVAAVGAIGESALATEAASTAGGMAANGATAGEITSTLTAGGVAPEAAASIANTATGIATGTVDAGAVASAGGVTPEMIATANASADPIATLSSQAGWTPSAATTAATTAEATTGAVAPLTELNAAQTAELMKNIDPNMISSLAPTTTGTAAGTAGSLLEGTSINPITNVLTNVGITNPIVNGALTGAATGAGINALTGRPITGDSLLMGALGGGVAGGIGAALPDLGGGVTGSALAGAATNVGATIAVNAVTGQPITASTLAGAALTGGVIGAGIQVATDGAGNSTYEYEDGSSMTVNRQGTPVAATDNTGATVPVAAVDSRTGQPKQLAPVEDRSIPVKPDTQATVDVNNMTQEQLNQTLSQNNPYMTASEPTQVAGPYTPAQEAQYKQLVAEGRTPAEATDIVESGQDTGPAVPVSITGAAGTAEAPSYAIDAQRTPNTQLATQAEIDAGTARFNDAANAWEVTPTPTPTPAPVAVVPTVATTPAPVAPVTAVTEPATPAPAAPSNVATETNAPVVPVTTLPEVTITAPKPEPQAPVSVPPLTPVQTANLTPSEPIPEVRAPEQPAPAPETNTPTAPVTPEPVYPPVYVPPVDLTPKTPTYGPITPLDWGNVGHVNAPGLNPGFITNVPRYYNNPSPVAAQYYWGQHPYQAGQTFNRGLYNTLPVAPATPFGLQQMYNPQTQTIQNLLQGVQQASAVAPYNIPRAPAV